jgi:hypothetical protein
MADLVITAASVLSGAGALVAHGTAGAALTAGQVVYLDEATSTYKLSDSNSATAAVRDVDGIALHAAASGQPIAVHTRGPITIGATLVAGQTYAASETPGGIQPVADLGSGEYPTILGMATSTTVLNVKIQTAGVAL